MEGNLTLQLVKSSLYYDHKTVWTHSPSIRSPSILYSLTKDWIQSPNPATTVGSSVLRSGRGTTVSPNQHCSSLVVLLQSMAQCGWYCDYVWMTQQLNVWSTWKSNFTCSLNIYVDKSGVIEVAMTSLTTTSIIKYLERFNNVVFGLWMHSHSATMQFLWKTLEIVRRAKPRVELRSIRNPVSVVGISIWRSRTFIVLGNRTDPDWNTKSDILMVTSEVARTCGETCVLNVV